jgi:hypothetical protein
VVEFSVLEVDGDKAFVEDSAKNKMNYVNHRSE